MKFQPDVLAGTNVITRHDADALWVGNQRFGHSLLVPWQGAVLPWAPARPDDLEAAHFEAMLALQPELVIFGSGARLKFVSPALMRALIERRIGVETMDTAAACRTYNVLVSEHRRALALGLHGDRIGGGERRIVGIEELVKNGSADEKSVARHARSIRAACASITSAAAIIDPLLPRTRTVKDVIDLFDFVTEYKENRKGGLDREGIDFEINGKAGKAVAKINRGRLLAVLDNLTRNSVYWLRRGADVLELKRPKHIRVDITSSGFSLSDSGPGIDPDYEDSIFDMFISAKPAGERGQGLGLFISSQLLAADGCSISLSTDRNQEGRRHKFIVDLGAVIQGGRK